MIESQEQIKKIEAIKSLAAFNRYASGFEVYQSLYREAGAGEEEVGFETLRERMRALHIDQDAKALNDAPSDERALFEDYLSLFEEILLDSEKGEFSRDKFAASLLESKFGRSLIEKWQPKKEGYTEPDGKRVFINETMNYFFDDEEGEQISLHIEPMDMVNPFEIMKKVREGLRMVAEKMKSGVIGAQQVQMVSWFLSEAGAKRFFGKDIKLDFMDSPNDARPALTYDSTKLEKYLKTGEMPMIGRILLPKDEFIKRVG